MILEKYRTDFPIFAHQHYINSCSYGALSQQVEAACADYLNCRRTQGADWPGWCAIHEDVRARFAQLVGAGVDEVAVTTSASAGMSSLASALDFGGGRNGIITTDQAFPTEAQIWHALAPRGARVQHVRENGNVLDLEHMRALVDGRTLLVAVPLVCYRHGALNDIAEIVRIAHDAGALVLVDGFQGLGAVPFDVRETDVDFLAGGALKYLLGSAGIGYFYARASLIEGLYPAQTGWFAQADIHAMKIHGNEPSSSARRFEQGTPSVPALYAAKAGLDYVLKVGVDNIRTHVQGLNRALKAGVNAQGGTLASATDDAGHGPMVAIRSTDDHALVAAMSAERIITSCRDGNLRVSAHLYNDMSDIGALLAGLQKHRSLLA